MLILNFGCNKYINVNNLIRIFFVGSASNYIAFFSSENSKWSFDHSLFDSNLIYIEKIKRSVLLRCVYHIVKNAKKNKLFALQYCLDIPYLKLVV